MSHRRRTLLVGLLSIAVVLGGCSTPPIRYFKGPPGAIESGRDLPSAVAYLQAVRGQYQDAVEGQIKDERGLSNALLGAGAAVIALAVGGANTNIIAGTTLAAGTAYGLGNLNLPRQRVSVYMSGVEALTCAQKAVAPIYVTSDTLEKIEAAAADLVTSRAALAAALASGRTSLRQQSPPNPDDEYLARALDVGSQVLQSSESTVNAAHALVQVNARAARDLVVAVNGIDEAVVRSLVNATPELSAVPSLVAGLAGISGSFAPGSGVDALLAGKLKRVVPPPAADGTMNFTGTESIQRTAAGDIVAAAADTTEKDVSLKSLLPQAVQWPEDAFKSCGVSQVISELSVSTSPLRLTVGLDAQLTFGISGGVRPYAVQIEGPQVDGISVRPPTGFGNQVEVRAVGSKLTKPVEARISIVDNSPNTARRLDVPLIVSGAGTKDVAGDSAEKSPVEPSTGSVGATNTAATDSAASDLKKIKAKGKFSFGGKVFVISAVPVLNGDAIEVAVTCPDNDVRKRADLVNALAAEAGMSEASKKKLRLKTAPSTCARD